MSAALASLVALIGQHPGFAYAAVLLLAMSESLPVVGVFVPGTAAILAVSTLVPSGAVALWPLIAAATVGAITGDALSYQLGRRYHSGLLSTWPLNRYPGLLASSRAFFERHGDKSVFLARFVPGVRAFVPMMAGVLHLPPARFYTANVTSALVWAPTHILPGVLVGASVGAAGHAAGPLAALLMTLVLLLWASRKLLLALQRFVVPRVVRTIDRLRTRLVASATPGALRLAALLDSSRPAARTLVPLGVALLGASWLFLGILEDVVTGDPLVVLDAAVYHGLDGLRSAPGDRLMIAVTELGDPVVVIAVTLAVGAWLLRERLQRAAAYWLAAVLGATLLNTVIKTALHRARPIETLYAGADAFSFPSGHSTVNLVMWGFLGLLLTTRLEGFRRTSVASTVTIIVVAVAFSRLYLGAHWFSDVAGGLAFGGAWLLLVWIGFTRGPVEGSRVGPLALVATLAFVVAGGVHVVRSSSGDASVYARTPPPLPTLTRSAWRAGGWQDLPVVRTGSTGEREEPFVLQVAAEPSTLDASLVAAGWRASSAWTGSGTLAWFDRGAHAATLPVLPALAAGRWPASVHVRPLDGDAASRLVLRLWRSDLVLDGNPPVAVLLGSLVEERVQRLLRIVPWLRTIDANSATRAAVATLPASLGSVPIVLTDERRE